MLATVPTVPVEMMGEVDMSITRAQLYLGDDCNFNCKYCYRQVGTFRKRRDINYKFLDWIIDNKAINVVSFIGGEPLLYWDMIKTIFDYINDGNTYKKHMKIITNGSLLTAEIVEYCNNHDIEVSISHDGEVTEQLRGVDVLKDERLLALIKKIKLLTVSAVITKYNNDVCKVFEYVYKHVQRPLTFMQSIAFCDGLNQELIDGIDFDLIQKSMLEKALKHCDRIPYPEYMPNPNKDTIICSFDLDGNILNVVTLAKFANYQNSNEEIWQIIKDKGLYKTCEARKCSVRDECTFCKTLAGDNFCRYQHVLQQVKRYIKFRVNGGLNVY